MTEHDAPPVLPGGRYAVVCARWNPLVTDRLLEGALGTLRRLGADEDALTVARVPGTFELGAVCHELAKSGRFDAVLGLGCVVKGETEHDRYINASVAASLQATGRETGVPTLFGVVTTNDFEQALGRAGGKHGNKGSETAAAAVETAGLLRSIRAGAG